MLNPVHELDQVQSILSVLAQILARGLTSEQRDTVLRGMPIVLGKRNGDEFAFYRALLDTYETRQNLDFVVDLTRRIEGTRSFYQDVGPDLDRLRFLLSKQQQRARQTNDKPFVFVLMPFREENFVIYERTIKPTLENIRCRVEHAKDAHTVERIVDAIFTQIARAQFIVADTTGKNPNVFYEIGYAHALGKKVILLVQDAQDIPFDIAGLRHIQYKPHALNALAVDLRSTANALLRETNDLAA
ncbi:MAG: hypothetical protein BroJett039_07830 [Chloroflexota bacterium]|jgi:hypothetical protein|nr:MAG: hypothetical protein B6D41_05585 [Chloroflexi bacterium UTCFX4]GIL15610.1 MAG: hypothetical protein BroJett039_07830 [Chloroflexota bacterium]